MADAIVLCGYSKVRYSTKPAGAYVVANVFRSMGLSCVVIDHVFALPLSDLEVLFRRYADERTKFICVSTTLLGPIGSTINVMSECDRLLEPILRVLKILAPNAKTIVGGSKITRGDLSSLPFDYQVKGQAERTLKAIVRHELVGEPLVSNQGVVDDKTYGYQTYSEDDYLRFEDIDGVLHGETLPAEVGRGCVFKCAFCDYDLIGKKFGDYTKNFEQLQSFFLHNYDKFGTTRYQFSDDTLNDSEEKIDLIYRVSNSLPFDLEFGGYIRAELLEKHGCTKLLDAGLRGANIGIETFNKQAGATVGKGFGERAWKVLDDLRKAGGPNIAVNINLIVGLPNDSLKDLERQAELVVQSSSIDNVFYTPLGIPKVGGSLFSEGGWRRYYTETDVMTERIRESYAKHPQTRTFFDTNINWQSEHLNVSEAIELSNRFQKHFEANRPYVINRVTAFCVMSLLEHFSMSEMRRLLYVEAEPILLKKVSDKVRLYYNLMRSVEVSSTEGKLIGEPVLPLEGFKSKIHWVKHEQHQEHR